MHGSEDFLGWESCFVLRLLLRLSTSALSIMRCLFFIFLCLASLLSAADVSGLLERAEMAFQAGRWDEARKTYGRAAGLTEDAETRAWALERLGEINLDLLFSRLPQEECVRVEVLPGDTLQKIAKRAGTTVELLRKTNVLRGDMIRRGQRLKVPRVGFEVRVDKSDNTLTLFWGGRFFKRYRVSTGSGGNTPVGEFRIVNRIVHPEWWHPETGERIPYGDSRHRIGTHWLGWDRKGFGIHGTDEPESIGQSVSLGCVRLRNEDVEELYTLLPEGAKVVVRE